MFKKMFSYLLDFILYSVLIIIGVFCYTNVIRPLSQSNFYSYEKLPIKYKYILDEYELEAKKHNKDVSLIKKLNYAILTDSEGVMWGGGGYEIVNLIMINETFQSDDALRTIVWHELGHVVLNYGHDLKKVSSHIMGNEKITYTTWEQKKYQYFNEPIPKNYIQNNLKSFYSNNYAIKYFKYLTDF